MRTRGLNGALYWGSQMLGSVLFSRLLDWKRFSRRTRAIIAVSTLFVFFNIVWIGALISQLQYGIYSTGVSSSFSAFDSASQWYLCLISILA